VSIPTVELASIVKTYRRSPALRQVDLAAGLGITGLLGPNGAGKSTLLRIAATVLDPDSGQVRLLGLDPAQGPARTDIRRRLGYLPQEVGVHRFFTVFEFVDYIAILKEMTSRQARHREVHRVLNLVGLDNLARKRIYALSGGMRRRLVLAQALLGDPHLLLLDEPTAGLDPEQRLCFRELISHLGTDRTVLISSHNSDDIATLCTNVVVLHAGQVVYTGTTTHLTATAHGRVWLSDQRAPGAVLAWRTGDGHHRNIGTPPAGTDTVTPALEDAYLLLIRQHANTAPEHP